MSPLREAAKNASTTSRWRAGSGSGTGAARRTRRLARLASGLDWTIVRACWLFNSAGISDYLVCEGSPHGMFTARADFAACLLAQLASERPARVTIGVRTVAATPSIPAQIWHEVINKKNN